MDPRADCDNSRPWASERFTPAMGMTGCNAPNVPKLINAPRRSPRRTHRGITETLADEDDIEAPDWAEFTKTGVDRELPPEQEDFWTRRAASLLRKVAVDGPVGVNALRSEYGTSKQGTTRYRVRPHQKTKGSGDSSGRRSSSSKTPATSRPAKTTAAVSPARVAASSMTPPPTSCRNSTGRNSNATRNAVFHAVFLVP